MRTRFTELAGFPVSFAEDVFPCSRKTVGEIERDGAVG